MHRRSWSAIALLLAACSSQQAATPPDTAASASAAAPAEATAKLEAVLAKQSDDVKARYPQRHPKEMMEFLGVQRAA